MLRALFQSLSIRERLLLVAFLWILLILWLFTLTEDVRSTWTAMRNSGQELRTQEQWLSNRPVIEDGLRAATDRLDPDKTFNATQLAGRLDEIARETEARFDISSPSTQEGDIFKIHTVRVSIRDADLATLVRFEHNLRQELPYIGLARVQLSTTRMDPRQLDAQFTVESFELTQTSF